MGKHSAPAPLAPETALFPMVHKGPIPPQTLGAGAVGMAGFTDRAYDNAEYFRETGTADQAAAAQTQFEESRRQTLEMLHEVRSRIAEAPANLAVDGYLDYAFGHAFEDARQRGAPHTSVRSWLADGEHGATNRELHDFCRWHVEHIASRLQSPEMIGTIERARAKYITAAGQAIDMGLYVPEARGTLQRVRDVKVLSGDFWDAQIMGGNVGYHFAGTDYLVLAQNTVADREAETTTVHELDHVQFYHENLTARLPAHFIEAMAEHSALSIEHGWWHVINPYERREKNADSNIYTPDRVFVDMILNEGKEKIGSELAIRAHSAPAGHQAIKDYLNAVRRSWGADVHEWAQPRIEQYQQELEEAGSSRAEAKKWAFERVKTEMRNGEHLKPPQETPDIRRHTVRR